MTQRRYRYVCVCGELLPTWVTDRDMKAGEQCEQCRRVYDGAYDGLVKPTPLPAGAKVTLNERTIHTVYRPVTVDGPTKWLNPSVQATLTQEIV